MGQSVGFKQEMISMIQKELSIELKLFQVNLNKVLVGVSNNNNNKTDNKLHNGITLEIITS